MFDVKKANDYSSRTILVFITAYIRKTQYECKTQRLLQYYEHLGFFTRHTVFLIGHMRSVF